MDSTKDKTVSLWLKIFALGILTLAYSAGEAIGAGIYRGNLLWVAIGVLGALFLVFIGLKHRRRLLTVLLLSFVGIITAFVWPWRTVYLYTGAISLFLIAAGAVGAAKSTQHHSQSKLTDEGSASNIPGGYTGRIITFMGELMEVATWIVCFLLVVVYEFQLFPLYQWLSSHKGAEIGIAVSCTGCIGVHILLSMNAYDPRREYRWAALWFLAVWVFISFFFAVYCPIREWLAFFVLGSLTVFWCSASLFMESFAFLPLSQKRRQRNDNLITGSSDEISRRTRDGKGVSNMISAPGSNYKSEHNESRGTKGKKHH